MSKALYRKYRGRDFKDIIGQTHVTDSLENAIKSKRIAHAYLFAGPRGVGKTSVARILAHRVNELEYKNLEQTHLDIVEIDAASNRRIDEIRELRSKIFNAPTSAKYKVYIIDEVHMLTNEAFNALLKTLEEPPEHAIFILATTEVHKLPETIISRTQHHTFRPVDSGVLVKHMGEIAKKEKIDISNNALSLIASHGEGSVRDSIGLLDQVANMHDKRVELVHVQDVLGMADEKFVEEIFEAIRDANIKKVIDLLEDSTVHGANPNLLAKQIIKTLRTSLMSDKPIFAPAPTLELIDHLLEVDSSINPLLKLEVALLKMINASASSTTPEHSAAELSKGQKDFAQSVPKSSKKSEETINIQNSKKEITTKKSNAKEPSKRTQKMNDSMWQKYLTQLHEKHGSLYAIMRMAHIVDQTDSQVTLGFNFPLHQNRINEEKNKRLAEDVMSEITGETIKISAIIDKTEAKQPTNGEATLGSDGITEPHEDVKNVLNIMGGEVVYES